MRAAPQVTYAAPTTMTYAAPTMTYAAPQVVEYAAPQMMYGEPQIVEYAAPQVVEYAAPTQVIEYAAPEMIVQPAVRVSRGINAPNNLLAAGQVISERVISIQELAAQNRYFAEEERQATTITRGIEMVQMVEQPTVTYAAPTYAAPTYGVPVTSIRQAPMMTTFDQLDRNHDGVITRQEFMQSMR